MDRDSIPPAARLWDPPIDSQIRITPKQTELALRSIVIADLVEHLRFGLQGDTAVCESNGNKNPIPIVGTDHG